MLRRSQRNNTTFDYVTSHAMRFHPVMLVHFRSRYTTIVICCCWPTSSRFVPACRSVFRWHARSVSEAAAPHGTESNAQRLTLRKWRCVRKPRAPGRNSPMIVQFRNGEVQGRPSRHGWSRWPQMTCLGAGRPLASRSVARPCRYQFLVASSRSQSCDTGLNDSWCGVAFCRRSSYAARFSCLCY